MRTGSKTLEGFFDLLRDRRCAQIRFGSCDAKEWISDLVRLRCDNATICLDEFHRLLLFSQSCRSAAVPFV